MAKVLCFGELLLRMSPSADMSWLKENNMPVYIGGAELNVANALAAWNMPVAYSTALPDHYLSASICAFLKQKGIDTDPIFFTGKRIGIYFLPQGTDLKNAGVIYDREHSSFAGLKPGVIDWAKVLEGVTWFHFSAISPALNENTAAVCREGVLEAAKRNIPISVDLNYRASLWKDGRQPTKVMHELVKHCTVVMGNIWSANTLLGIPVDGDIHLKTGRSHYLGEAEQSARAIQERFPNCETVANTFRFDKGAGQINYFASLNHHGHAYHAAERCSKDIVDRVGSGDCFMAGLIYGLIRREPPQQIVDFASTAAFMKMQEAGDSTNHTADQIKSNIQHDE